MKARTFFALIAAGLLAAYLGYRQIENYIHETVIYPPEILAKPYLTFDYRTGDLRSEDVTVRFDFKKPLIYIELNHGTLTQAYDYSLNLNSQTKTMDYSERQKHPEYEGDPDTRYIVPGHYDFEFAPGTVAYGGEISDLPGTKHLETSDDRNIGNRGVIDYTLHYDTSPVRTIGMKDWSIQFDGKWRTEMGAYATGDNLFGATEKHTLPLAFYTGTWTLIVRGQPVFRQRVKNLPIGADFYYSPVYGLVLLEYQNSETKSTLYVIKVPASGPDVYNDLKDSETIVGVRPRTGL